MITHHYWLLERKARPKIKFCTMFLVKKLLREGHKQKDTREVSTFFKHPRIKVQPSLLVVTQMVIYYHDNEISLEYSGTANCKM